MKNILNNPFDLNNTDAYLAWRERKLTRYPSCAAELRVEIRNPHQLSTAEHAALLDNCSRANMAIYVCNPHSTIEKEHIHALGLQLGLKNLDHNPGADEDAVSAITVQEGEYHREYVPYTNKAIAWHTDGYYNTLERQVHSIILHCVQPALEGGYNQLLDHELLYIAVRDFNSNYIHALMQPQAMSIPANVINGIETRPISTGPVFSINDDGSLHLRYTDRARNISWYDDSITQEAVAFVKEWLHNVASNSFNVKLEANQGLIANNVLHTRSAFVDGVIPRLLYRARYYERMR